MRLRDRQVGDDGHAARERERRDAGLVVARVGPAAVVRAVIVRVGVPERAVVGGVDAHPAVVAPAMADQWIARDVHAAVEDPGPGAGHDRGLAHPHGAQGIAGQTARVLDAREVARGDGGGAVTQRHVARIVHGQAAHPPPQHRVRRVDLLLDDGRADRSCGDVDLPPLRGEGSAERERTGRMDHPQGLHRSHLAVLHPLHEPIAEAVEEVHARRRRGLRHDVAGEAAVGGVGHDGRRPQHAARHARSRNVELPHVEGARRGRLLGEVLGSARCGEVVALAQHVGGEEREVGRSGQEAQRPAHGQPVVHVALVERGHDLSGVRSEAAARETVRAHVQAVVVPVPELGIVVEGVGGDRALVDAQGVEPPAAGDGIPALGDGEALIEGRDGDARSGSTEPEGEVGQDPAVGGLVVHHDGVAEPVGVARGPHSLAVPQRVLREGRQPSPRRLVVDRVGLVDPLDVMREAHVAVSVRGMPGPALAARAGVEEAQAGEVHSRSGCGRQRGRGVGGRAAAGGKVAVHVVGRLEQVELGLLRRGDLRQVADVTVEGAGDGRADGVESVILLLVRRIGRRRAGRVLLAAARRGGLPGGAVRRRDVPLAAGARGSPLRGLLLAGLAGGGGLLRRRAESLQSRSPAARPRRQSAAEEGDGQSSAASCPHRCLPTVPMRRPSAGHGPPSRFHRGIEERAAPRARVGRA